MHSTTTFDPVVNTIITILTWLLFGVPFYAILWQLYKKAGQAGWAVIIPVYGSYVMGAIGKVPMLGLIAGIGEVLYVVIGYTPLHGNGVIAILALVWAVIGLLSLRKFIMRYDAGVGRWFLFLFLPLIGMFFVKSVKFKDDSIAPVSLPTSTPIPPAPIAASGTVQPIAPSVSSDVTSSQLPPSNPPTQI